MHTVQRDGREHTKFLILFNFITTSRGGFFVGDLKLENYTKYQREMVGKSYVNCKGNTLTVKGVKGKRNNKTIYTLLCSECSKDKDLFPKDSLTCRGDSIRNQLTICGCSKKYKWKEYQYIIKIRRRCCELSYVFQGFASNYQGYKTKLILHNPSTGNTWYTTSIQTFLLKGVKDPMIKSQRLVERCTLPDEYLVKRFMDTGRFMEGTVFERKKDNKWEYTCPVCSNDEYVVNGLCDGQFSSSAGHLLEGKSCCRCHKGSYRWSAQQREYQLMKYFKPRGYEFVRWEDGYLNNSSNVVWKCSKGHLNTTNFSNLRSRLSCKTCSGNGFKTHLPAKLYIVRWCYCDYSILKFGITNKSVSSRVTNQKNKTDMTPEVLYVFTHESGSHVLDCENFIKSSMDTGCDRSIFPRGFTETVMDTPSNLELLLKIISTFKLHQTP